MTDSLSLVKLLDKMKFDKESFLLMIDLMIPAASSLSELMARQVNSGAMLSLSFLVKTW